LNPSFKGAHLLRHSLATDLLRRGASLTEIGQLLRHSQPTTTQIYAKVDIAALRTLGLAWPGAALMSPLRETLDEYLAMRRALGHKLCRAGRLLQQFVAFADLAGATLRHHRSRAGVGGPALWGGAPLREPVAWGSCVASRNTAARSTREPSCRRKACFRIAISVPTPYIYRDEEISRLLDAAQQLSSSTGLRPHTYSTLFGLYAVTGMRCREPLQLDRDDVDLVNGVLTIRGAKFGKSRYVPPAPCPHNAH